MPRLLRHGPYEEQKRRLHQLRQDKPGCSSAARIDLSCGLSAEMATGAPPRSQAAEAPFRRSHICQPVKRGQVMPATGCGMGEASGGGERAGT